MRDFLDPYGFKMPEIVGVSTGYTFSAQYQAVYDSFIVKPAADIAQQQDIMVRALVSSGIWAKLDVFYIFANNDRTNAVINWINPGTFDAIEVNAPTFLAYRHFVGNGVNQEINTQYTPSVHATNYLLNNSSFGVYSQTDLNAVVNDIGIDSAADSQLFLRSPNFVVRHNDAASTNMGANADSLGFHLSSRIVAGTKTTYKNGLLHGNAAVAATGLPTTPFYILSRGGAGFSTRQISMAYIGGGIADVAEATAFFTPIETYLDYVGAGVV